MTVDNKIHELDLARVEHDGRLERLEDAAKDFVTKEQFSSVKILVYGFAGLILTGFAGAIIKLVITK